METNNNIEFGWLVGIFDGEGNICITFARSSMGYVGIANKDRVILKRCLEITKGLGIPPSNYSPGFISLVWNGYTGTPLLEKLLPHICNTKQQKRAAIYLKWYDPKYKHKPQRTRRLQLWEEWKELVRGEYTRGENRGPRPHWL